MLTVKISQSINATGVLMIEMTNNSFSESKKSVGCLIEKIEILSNIILLDFAKYLGYSEVQKNSKVVNV